MDAGARRSGAGGGRWVTVDQRCLYTPSFEPYTGAASSVAAGWHTVALTVVGTVAEASLDGAKLFDAQSVRRGDTGFAAIGASDWGAVEFRNFS
eukprot:gene2017-4754_t